LCWCTHNVVTVRASGSFFRPLVAALPKQVGDPSPQNTSYRGGREVAYDSMESVLNFKPLSFLITAIQVVSLGASVATANAETGVASVYSTESGSKTASGARLNPGALTAAHRSLPFGSRVRVTNHSNGHSVVVTINDRGPFVRGRIIDLTPASAHALGMSGLAPVTVERE
jgi:rare lipoprotein A